MRTSAGQWLLTISNETLDRQNEESRSRIQVQGEKVKPSGLQCNKDKDHSVCLLSYIVVIFVELLHT
jgi:hypothetical protein